MDVPLVYTRRTFSCTPVLERQLSTIPCPNGSRAAGLPHSGSMTVTRRLPPPAWVLFALVVSIVGAQRAVAVTDWSWPLVGPILRPFERPASEYSEGHRGIDIGAIRGREVRSPVDGVVWFTGTVAGRSVISIDTADGSIVSIEPVESTVQRGDVVRLGDEVGLVSGTHDGYNAIHLGVRVNGAYVDPQRFLGNPPRIVVYDSWIDSYALG